MTKMSSANWRTKVIVIVGPTASGKSDLAIKLAKKYNGEIISADSRQVYKGMDIGTGKVARDRLKAKSLKTKAKQNSGLSPSALDLKRHYYSSGIEHHLIDVVSPKKQFTANDFKKLGEKAIKKITNKNKIPIIVGGTGFYIDILLGRMAMAEVPPNKKLLAQLDKFTAEKLFEKLKKLDPRRAKMIDSTNKRRLIRALEIVEAIGKVPALTTNYSLLTTSYDALWIGLKPKDLKKRIKNRLDTRLKEGMIKEVERLHKQGVSWKRLYDFGLEYRWVSRYLREVKSKKLKVKSFDKSEFYEKLLSEITKYSKRQMTWFKKNKKIHWIKNLPARVDQKEAEKLIKNFLTL